MSEREFVYQMRPIVLLCSKYHVSRKWFYKWKKRRDQQGDEGLKSKIRAVLKMPNKVPPEIEQQILYLARDYPTYWPERIEAELKSAGISVSHIGIYNVLKKRSLNRAKRRLEWIRKLYGEVVTLDETTRDKENKNSFSFKKKFLVCLKSVHSLTPYFSESCSN